MRSGDVCGGLLGVGEVGGGWLKLDEAGRGKNRIEKVRDVGLGWVGWRKIGGCLMKLFFDG